MNTTLSITQSEMQKGKGVVNRPLKKECVCYEPSVTIQCTACGAVMFGRVRVRCMQHQNTIYISDMDRCVKCLAPSYFLKDISSKKPQ